MRRENLAYGFHVLQLIESRVQFREPDVPVDQPVDRQAALFVQANEPWNIAHRHTRSHVAAANGFLLPDKIALIDAEGRI